MTILVNFRGDITKFCIPQSKIKDFCQPPLGKGAFIPNLKQLDESEYDRKKAPPTAVLFSYFTVYWDWVTCKGFLRALFTASMMSALSRWVRIIS